MASRFELYLREEESLNYMLWECNFSEFLWAWCAKGFVASGKFNSFKQTMGKCRNISDYVKELWSKYIYGAQTSKSGKCAKLLEVVKVQEQNDQGRRSLT